MGPRVETLIRDAAPHDAETQINLSARFHWRLKSSQRVRTEHVRVPTEDTHPEQKDEEASPAIETSPVTETEIEDFIQLVFERDIDEPNIDRIRALEAEYFSIVYPTKPGFMLPVIVCLLLGGLAALIRRVWVIGPILLLIAWISWNATLRAEADKEAARLEARQAEILREVDQL